MPARRPKRKSSPPQPYQHGGYAAEPQPASEPSHSIRRSRPIARTYPPLVFVHGISPGQRPRDWWRDWMRLLPDAVKRHSISFFPITWEPLESSQHAAARICQHWRWLPSVRNFLDLAGDLSAVLDPAVQRYVLDALGRSAASGRGLVILAHSLGSVLAYQALVEWPTYVRLLVTFGSPLWRADEFPSLLPAVKKPPGVHRWVNVYSPLDFFIGRRRIQAADVNVRAWCRHDAEHYLRSRAFRDVIAAELSAAIDPRPTSPAAAAA